ncbi:hypothetical protein [Halomonas alkalisoli]|nr:hypothetical protein [Halomonas alkalisoli]MCE9681357.1 hypothetical protein [Halomonas alkalisoli]
MTPSPTQTCSSFSRAPGAVESRGCGGQFGGKFGDQYWYWFSAGVPAAGS